MVKSSWRQKERWKKEETERNGERVVSFWSHFFLVSNSCTHSHFLFLTLNLSKLDTTVLVLVVPGLILALVAVNLLPNSGLLLLSLPFTFTGFQVLVCCQTSKPSGLFASSAHAPLLSPSPLCLFHALTFPPLPLHALTLPPLPSAFARINFFPLLGSFPLNFSAFPLFLPFFFPFSSLSEVNAFPFSWFVHAFTN